MNVGASESFWWAQVRLVAVYTPWLSTCILWFLCLVPFQTCWDPKALFGGYYFYRMGRNLWNYMKWTALFSYQGRVLTPSSKGSIAMGWMTWIVVKYAQKLSSQIALWVKTLMYYIILHHPRGRYGPIINGLVHHSLIAIQWPYGRASLLTYRTHAWTGVLHFPGFRKKRLFNTHLHQFQVFQSCSLWQRLSHWKWDFDLRLTFKSNATLTYIYTYCRLQSFSVETVFAHTKQCNTSCDLNCSNLKHVISEIQKNARNSLVRKAGVASLLTYRTHAWTEEGDVFAYLHFPSFKKETVSSIYTYVNSKCVNLPVCEIE